MISLRMGLTASGVEAGSPLPVESPTTISASSDRHCGMRMSRQSLTVGQACVAAITTESWGFFAWIFRILKFTRWTRADTTGSGYTVRIAFCWGVTRSVYAGGTDQAKTNEGAGPCSVDSCPTAPNRDGRQQASRRLRLNCVFCGHLARIIRRILVAAARTRLATKRGRR